jgi:hypothetical protein
MTDENRATIRKALKAFDDENFHNGNDCTLSSTALDILDAAPSPEPIQVHFEGTHPYGIDPENPEPAPAEQGEELIAAIADDLMTNGFGEKAVRLALRLPDERDGGGYNRTAIEKLLRSHLAAHRQPKESAKNEAHIVGADIQWMKC